MPPESYDPLDEIFSHPKVEIDDATLADFVKRADTEMEAEGVPIMARPIHLMRKIREHLGIGLTNRHPLYRRAAAMLDDLYPKRELSIQPLYRGAFLFRECLYTLGIGLVLGIVRGLDLRKTLPDMPEYRWRQLRSSEGDMRRFLDQVCDVFDFAQGVDDLSRSTTVSQRTTELLRVGKSHLETAAIAAIETRDREAALHSCFLAGELLLKGALAAKGCDEKQLRAYSHDLRRLARRVAELYPSLSAARLFAALSKLPQGVSSRYSSSNPSAEDAGHALMSAQYIGGAVLRRLTDRDLRPSLKIGGRPLRLERSYPPVK